MAEKDTDATASKAATDAANQVLQQSQNGKKIQAIPHTGSVTNPKYDAKKK